MPGTIADSIRLELEAEPPSAGGAPAQRYTRRLSDKVLMAFHFACDQSDVEVARPLLDVLELMTRRRPASPDGREHRVIESLVAAHERLWQIQHPEPDC
jgi:hypothetical protein